MLILSSPTGSEGYNSGSDCNHRVKARQKKPVNTSAAMVKYYQTEKPCSSIYRKPLNV